jgi:ATP-dependent Lon protease
MIPNRVAIAEVAFEKQATAILMPVATRSLLNDLPNELWTKISIEFYKNAQDAFFKCLMD